MKDGFKDILTLIAEARTQGREPTHVRLGRDQVEAIDIMSEFMGDQGHPRYQKILRLEIIKVDEESLIEVVSR